MGQTARYVRYIPIIRERGALILVCRIVKFGQRREHGAQLVRVSFIGSKLNLTRSVSGQNFVESEVEFFVAELRHSRWQMNGAAIANTRFDRHRGERRDLD